MKREQIIKRLRCRGEKRIMYPLADAEDILRICAQSGLAVVAAEPTKKEIRRIVVVAMQFRVNRMKNLANGGSSRAALLNRFAEARAIAAAVRACVEPQSKNQQADS